MRPMTSPLVLSLLLLACCGSESPPAGLSKILETEHFLYYAAPGDTVDSDWQESYYGWLVAKLDVSVSEKLEYYKYRGRAHLKALTGRETNGFAEVGTYKFHTIWTIDNHESVHTVVTQTIGHPPALFNEGIAVAHQADYFRHPDFVPAWNGQDFDLLSRSFESSGAMPALDALVESRSFFSFDTQMTYPIAGSFVRYLIDTHGVQPMKAFITGSAFDDARGTTRSRFATAYRFSLDDAWSDWKDFLHAVP